MSSRDCVKCKKQSAECLHCYPLCKKEAIKHTYTVLSVRKKYTKMEEQQLGGRGEEEVGLFSLFAVRIHGPQINPDAR